MKKKLFAILLSGVMALGLAGCSNPVSDSKKELEDAKNDKFDFSRQIKINMLYFTLNFLGEIKNSDLSKKDKEKECKRILNEKNVREIFYNFNIPNVGFKLKVVLLLIKYRLSFIYSMIFYS